MGWRCSPLPACASPSPRRWRGPQNAAERLPPQPVADDGPAAPFDAAVLETELKLSAASAEPLQRLAGMRSLGTLRLAEARTFTELDRYLDTDDGRLSSSHWACRLRRRSRRYLVSLKGPPLSPG